MRVSFGYVFQPGGCGGGAGQHATHKVQSCCVDGRPTGAVRFSFGYMSNLADAEAVVALVRDFFVEAGPLTSHPAAAAASAHPAAASRAATAAHAAVASQPGVAAGSRPAESPAVDISQAADVGAAVVDPAMPLPSTPPRPPPPRPATPPATTPRQRCGHLSGDLPADLGVSSAAAAAAVTTALGTACAATPSDLAVSDLAAPATSAAAEPETAAAAAGQASSQRLSQQSSRESPAGGARLSGLWVYPIKSCAAVQVLHNT